MRASGELLLAALHSASEALTGKRVRFEAFARHGESVQVTRAASGALERRSSREFGVGCRVSAKGRAGFGAAAGGGARAGGHAARIALAALHPAPDPLPPLSALGTGGTSVARHLPDSEAIEALVAEVAELLPDGGSGARVVQVRALAGTSSSALATAEGFHARATASGIVLELLVAPPEGPWRHFHFAAPAVADLDPATIAERVRETALLATRGERPDRRLTDLLLSPAVAAPVLEALARHLTAPSEAAPGVRVSRGWRLVDDRPGPQGLLPLPWDGEGLPARRIELVRDGTLGERLATWALAQEHGGAPGGAVRPSYRHPPVAGAANLVLSSDRPLSQADMLARLEDGFWVAAPAGQVRVDEARGRFELGAAAVALRHGRPVATHPLVEVRGSFRRLLAGVLAAGADSESFSLGCAVTTPSLLVHRLEIA